MNIKTLGTYVSYLGLCCAFFLYGCKSSEPPPENKKVKTVNYDQYETYDFGNAFLVNREDPLFKFPQLEKRIKRELKFDLPSKRLDYSTEDPDLKIYFYAITDEEGSYPVLSYEIGFAARPFLASGERLQNYPGNTLVIDFVDLSLNELVWRGSIALPFDDEEKLFEVLPKRIHQLLNPYPSVPD